MGNRLVLARRRARADSLSDDQCGNERDEAGDQQETASGCRGAKTVDADTAVASWLCRVCVWYSAELWRVQICGPEPTCGAIVRAVYQPGCVFQSGVARGYRNSCLLWGRRGCRRLRMLGRVWSAPRKELRPRRACRAIRSCSLRQLHARGCRHQLLLMGSVHKHQAKRCALTQRGSIQPLSSEYASAPNTGCFIRNSRRHLGLAVCCARQSAVDAAVAIAESCSRARQSIEDV
mmetsp:Transcript_2055/g.5491  ORF Transcript_2055/g.5491 Transcript_2055/m.5491 type:complete len:234 (-) Transcript_2055:2554-3255(-)